MMRLLVRDGGCDLDYIETKHGHLLREDGSVGVVVFSGPNLDRLLDGGDVEVYA